MPAQPNEINKSEIHELVVEEPASGTLPLYKAKYWALGFLLFSIVVAIVFGLTMPDFYRAAYHIH